MLQSHDVWLMVSWVALSAHAAYLIHPLCTRAHHQAGQMPQLTSWVSSESPPGRTEVNDAKGGPNKEVHKGKKVIGKPLNSESTNAWREGRGSRPGQEISDSQGRLPCAAASLAI